MDWEAILKLVATAALNALVGALVSHATGSPTAAGAVLVAGGALAHAAQSPFGDQK